MDRVTGHELMMWSGAYALIISVILSPFRRIRPNAFLDFFLIDNSSASSSTTFMYSSKPCSATGGAGSKESRMCAKWDMSCS